MNKRLIWNVMAGLALLILMTLAGCVRSQPIESLGNGLPEYGAITPQQAANVLFALQDNPGFVLLDIRTPEETATSHLSGAIELDFYSSTFGDDVAALDRDSVYLIYCRTGRRSGEAYEMMEDLGFQHVYDLAGGITSWIAKGYPVCSGPLDAQHICTGQDTL